MRLSCIIDTILDASWRLRCLQSSADVGFHCTAHTAGGDYYFLWRQKRSRIFAPNVVVLAAPASPLGAPLSLVA